MKGYSSVTVALTEIILRVIVILFCLGTLAISAVTFYRFESTLPQSIQYEYDTIIIRLLNINYKFLSFSTRLATLLGIVMSSITFLYEVTAVFISLIFLDVGFIRIKIFDVLMALILDTLIIGAGILAALTSASWAYAGNNLLINAEIPEILKTTDYLSGTAALSLGTAFTLSLLMMWVFYTLIQPVKNKWHALV